MRADIGKVLVERPRRGGAWADAAKGRGSRVAQRAQEREDAPLRESIGKRRVRRGTVKDFNENLSPLWRFLAVSVGRSWNRVYAEISEQNPKRSAIGAHIYQHLLERVTVHPLYIDGVAHHPMWGSEIQRDRYYVDRHGILRRGTAPLRRDRYREPKRPATFVPLCEGQIAKQDAEGRWYAVTLRPLEASAVTAPVWDVWRREHVRIGGYEAEQEYGDKNAVAISKRALCTREIAEIKAR